MRIHEITEGVVRRHGVPDWKQICEEQEAKAYPYRGILAPRPNVSHRLHRIDWRGVLYGLGLALAALVIALCVIGLGAL